MLNEKMVQEHTTEKGITFKVGDEVAIFGRLPLQKITRIRQHGEGILELSDGPIGVVAGVMIETDDRHDSWMDINLFQKPMGIYDATEKGTAHMLYEGTIYVFKRQPKGKTIPPFAGGTKAKNQTIPGTSSNKGDGPKTVILNWSEKLLLVTIE